MLSSCTDIDNAAKGDTISLSAESCNVKKEYTAAKDNGILTLFDDYDTVTELCKDACGEFMRAVRVNDNADFSPYMENPQLKNICSTKSTAIFTAIT